MLLRRIVTAALLALLPVGQVVACSLMPWDPDELVENTPVYSANGRFCAIVRWYEGVADFTSERAGKVFHFDPETAAVDAIPPSSDAESAAVAAKPPPRQRVTVAWYESTPNGHRRIAEVPLDIAAVNSVLVADSGRYLIAIRYIRGSPCGRPSAKPEDPVITIYRSDGTRVGSLTPAGILTPNDLRWSAFESESEYALRHESDMHEVVVLSFEVSRGKKESQREDRRIDLETATLLDAKRDLFPAPHVYATAAAAAPARPYAPPGPGCAAAWEQKDLLRIDSARLLAAAIDAPLPEFPPIARMARLRGTVQVEVIVSESGYVQCARHEPFPFGMADAADAATRHWKFRPFRVDGHPVKAAGEVLLHFDDLDEETWKQKNVPPFRLLSSGD